MIKSFVFSLMAGLIGFLCSYPFIMLCNGLKISEYEAYWLMDFFANQNLDAHQERILLIILSFKAVCTTYLKSKQASIRKN